MATQLRMLFGTRLCGRFAAATTEPTFSFQARQLSRIRPWSKPVLPDQSKEKDVEKQALSDSESLSDDSYSDSSPENPEEDIHTMREMSLLRELREPPGMISGYTYKGKTYLQPPEMSEQADEGQYSEYSDNEMYTIKVDPPRPWSQEELEKLKAAVPEDATWPLKYSKDWKRIAAAVGNGRTRRECIHVYENVINRKKPRKWTPQEDMVLLDAVERFKRFIDTQDESFSYPLPTIRCWSDIRSMFPGVSFWEIKWRHGVLTSKTVEAEKFNRQYRECDMETVIRTLTDIYFVLNFHVNFPRPKQNEKFVPTLPPVPRFKPEDGLKSQRMLLSDLYHLVWRTAGSFDLKMYRHFGGLNLDGDYAGDLKPTELLWRFIMTYGSGVFNLEEIELKEGKFDGYVSIKKRVADVLLERHLLAWIKKYYHQAPSTFDDFKSLVMISLNDLSGPERRWVTVRRLGADLTRVAKFALRSVNLTQLIKHELASDVEIQGNQVRMKPDIEYFSPQLELGKMIGQMKKDKLTEDQISERTEKALKDMLGFDVDEDLTKKIEKHFQKFHNLEGGRVTDGESDQEEKQTKALK